MTNTNLFQVGETRDYSRFKIILGNRDLTEKNIRSKQECIAKRGLMVPIIVNTNFEIIDGQNRFVALQRLGLPVHFIISKAWKNMSDTIAMQNAVKWTSVDHCKSNADLGDEQCALALETASDWHRISGGRMSIASGIGILWKAEGTNCIASLKSGSYTVDLERGKRVFDSALLMSQFPMKCKGFSQKMMYGLKMLDTILEGKLDPEVMAKFPQKYLIQNYANSQEFAEFFDFQYEKVKRGR